MKKIKKFLVLYRQRGVAYKTVNESTAGWSSPGHSALPPRLNNVKGEKRRRELRVLFFFFFFLFFSLSSFSGLFRAPQRTHCRMRRAIVAHCRSRATDDFPLIDVSRVYEILCLWWPYNVYTRCATRDARDMLERLLPYLGLAFEIWYNLKIIFDNFQMT